MDEFFVKVDGGEKGPFTFDELTDGRLEPNDMVRTPITEWEKAADIADFAEYFRYEGYYFPTEANLAGYGIRLLAFLIDHVAISFMLGIGISVFSDYVPFKIESLDMKNTAIMLWIQQVYVIALVIYNFIFYVLPLSSTPGQYLCRLIIVDADGKKINIAKALIRSAGKLLSVGLYGIGTLAIFFTPYRQALHDLIAKTYVVRRDAL